MKVLDFISYGVGAIIGIILGVTAFLKLYLPLKAGLGLDIAASQSTMADGPIVPMKNLVPVYTMAGGIIDFIVLVAFVVAGIYLVIGILQVFRKKP